MTLTVERRGAGRGGAGACLRCGISVVLALFAAACSHQPPDQPEQFIVLDPFVEQENYFAAPGVSSDEYCGGMLQVAQCWLRLDSKEKCYVWQEEPLAGGATVTWSGGCEDERANGKGTLAIAWHNHWRHEAEIVQEGELADGRKTGHWIVRHQYMTERGDYENGRKTGTWELSGPNGWTFTERHNGHR